MAYCVKMTLPDGTTALVRMSGKKPPACRWCGVLSTKLCDFDISHPSQVTHRKTCDAPMCDQHAKHVGPDRDYCPDHAKERISTLGGLFPSDPQDST